ncbi:hypothetical protein BDR06DRAFT_1010621 [Suillus hirtellus]|nr:hypothetical protein BDR06DRAFT_1010621 [Suillus hirtellus]
MSLSTQSRPCTSHDGVNDIRAGEVIHPTEACNIVIFGKTGAGKSSLVNLITRQQLTATSSDAMGCTIKTNMYERDVAIQNKTLKVKVFDTAGLDEGSEGAVLPRLSHRSFKETIGASRLECVLPGLDQ